MNYLVIRLTTTTVLTLCLLTFVFAQGTTITLLHVNDTHSHLDAFGPKDASLNGTLGGIAKAASVIGTVRATEPNVLLLHSGDFMVGDFFFNKYFGIPELQMMKQLGFDAMTVGNHEFDLGSNVLALALSTAFPSDPIPIVSANLDLSGYPPLQSFIQPSIMKTIDGVKIGIFGLTTPNPLNNPYPVIISEDIFTIAAQQVSALRTAGAQVVICLSHFGIYYDKIIAYYVPGINFIVGGHDHYLFEQPITVPHSSGSWTTQILQAGEYYKNIGKLSFTVDGGNVTVNNYQILSVDASVPAFPPLQAVVDDLKFGIVAQYGDVYFTPIGNAVKDLNEVADPNSAFKDTPLGNLVTDAFRAKTGTKIAITANGLIAEKIYAGPIVGADVFRPLSYGYDVEAGLGFRIATFDIRGSELKRAMEIAFSQIDVSEDYYLQVSGMVFKYSPKKPSGNRIVFGSIKINGKQLIPVSKYSVTVSTGMLYLLTTLGVNVENVQLLPDFEYHVVKGFIANLNNVNYNIEGRVQDMSIHSIAKGYETEDTVFENIEVGYKLYDNYPNPFNPSTIIGFYLPSEKYITLKIYNTLGQEVASLVDGVYEAGEHQVKWKPNNLSSGIYIYQLQTNNSVERKKMILLK